VTGSSFDAIGTIGEFAAGGAVAAFAIRLLIQGLRNLRARVERADPPGATGPGTPPWNDDTAEPSDARVMGEALFGSLLGGWAGAYYVHALAFLKDPRDKPLARPRCLCSRSLGRDAARQRSLAG
jgi:hypothetical protein